MLWNMLENLQMHARLTSQGQATLDHELSSWRFLSASFLTCQGAQSEAELCFSALGSYPLAASCLALGESGWLTVKILGKPQTLQAFPAAASRGRKVATGVGEQLVARK